MTAYKRQYRQLSDDTKRLLSLKNRGRKKSETHKQHISQSMIDYWKSVPNKPTSGETL